MVLLDLCVFLFSIVCPGSSVLPFGPKKKRTEFWIFEFLNFLKFWSFERASVRASIDGFAHWAKLRTSMVNWRGVCASGHSHSHWLTITNCKQYRLRVWPAEKDVYFLCFIEFKTNTFKTNTFKTHGFLVHFLCSESVVCVYKQVETRNPIFHHHQERRKETSSTDTEDLLFCFLVLSAACIQCTRLLTETAHRKQEMK